MANECTNLLAVVAKNTEGSQWVLHEIGVAEQAPPVFSSMTNLSDKIYQVTGWKGLGCVVTTPLTNLRGATKAARREPVGKTCFVSKSAEFG